MTGGYQWLYIEQVWSPVWLLVLYDGWLSVAVYRTSVVTSVAIPVLYDGWLSVAVCRTSVVTSMATSAV